jgi:hypothetical protein
MKATWIDMTPYILKDNTIYFTGPNQVIVKGRIQTVMEHRYCFYQRVPVISGKRFIEQVAADSKSSKRL